GPGAARNLGVSATAAPYCLFLDDDMAADARLVSAHLSALDADGDRAVLGAIDTDCLGHGGAYRFMVESYWGERHHRLSNGGEVRFDECFSGNLSLRTATLRRLGCFDETLARGEDVDLGVRLERAGVPLCYASAAVAHQEYRKTPVQSIDD